MLIVLSGLPGVGKSTVAQVIARQIGAMLLRVDVIEQAMRVCGLNPGPAGYVVGYALARSNLALGRSVVADSVNPVEATRSAWREAGDGKHVVEVEVICSDRRIHRARVEGRSPDMDGLTLPAWPDILAHVFEPWTQPRIVVDTARRTPNDAAAQVLAGMGGDGIEPPALSV